MRKQINFDNNGKRVFVTANIEILPDCFEAYFKVVPPNILNIALQLEGVKWYGEDHLLLFPKNEIVYIGDADTNEEGIEVK